MASRPRRAGPTGVSQPPPLAARSPVPRGPRSTWPAGLPGPGARRALSPGTPWASGVSAPALQRGAALCQLSSVRSGAMACGCRSLLHATRGSCSKVQGWVEDFFACCLANFEGSVKRWGSDGGRESGERMTTARPARAARSLKIRQQSTSISMGAQPRSFGSGAAPNEERTGCPARGEQFSCGLPRMTRRPEEHSELESLILAQSER
jgi:hypothetical protein